MEIYSQSTTCDASNGGWDRQESQRKIETDKNHGLIRTRDWRTDLEEILGFMRLQGHLQFSVIEIRM